MELDGFSESVADHGSAIGSDTFPGEQICENTHATPCHAMPCHAMPCGCHAMSICPPELGQRDHTPQLHQRLCRCNSLCASHKVWHGSRKFLANINGMLFKNAVLVGRFNSFAEKVAYIHELHAHPVVTTTRRTCKSKSHGPIGSGQIEG